MNCNYKNMKKNIFISIFLACLVPTTFSSCLDTTVLPVDRTIGEEFWQSRSDVQSMVAGAYQAMASEAVVERCIVWGDVRSDEVTHLSEGTDAKETAIREIRLGNMTSNNVYADWTQFYQVINRCNLVLEKAPNVLKIDPGYTQSQLATDQSQMLALRSLCYFYLLRAFRDVPVTSGAYMNSSQDMENQQQAPAVVLERIISDLNTAAGHPLSASGFSDWRRYGYINRTGIQAILADVYLWRASMTHDAADYQRCVDACEEVISSKMKEQDVNTYDELLISGREAYNQIFVGQNSDESIFELQLDGSNIANVGLRNMYYYGGGTLANGLLKGTKIFRSDVFADDEKNFDYRYYESVVNLSDANATEFAILKMTDNERTTNGRRQLLTERPARSADRFAQNWIVYRLTDVMLMEAEALVQLGKLNEAFELVNAVHRRSLTDVSKNTLVAANYSTVSDMEKLVLEERQRELCFEGKRWFDLMRYNYRHMDLGDIANPASILADCSYVSTGLDVYWPSAISQEMRSLVERGYTEGGTAILSKIGHEPYLYFPVLKSELNVNYALRQNPVYQEADVYEKN